MNSIERIRPQCVGVVPARYGSSRFPGKPLALIAGMPMFWHVCTRAARCPLLDRVLLATDDERILARAQELDIEAVMTSTKHQSGTDRAFEAVCGLDLPHDAVVANIQGDEPALEPAMLEELLSPFADTAVQACTLARPLDSQQELHNHDRVKVVLDSSGNALYFSRAAIPHVVDEMDDAPGSRRLLHIGLYAYRLEVLRRFTSLQPGPLEQAEKLEQLRLLENGIPIRVALTAHRSHGVDRPQDIALIERYFTES